MRTIGRSIGITTRRVHQLATRARMGRETILAPQGAGHLCTPDGRYLVMRGRLWRRQNPFLSKVERDELVQQLLTARRALVNSRIRKDLDAEMAARTDIDRVKRLLGEKGPVWWEDGSPDLNRHMVHTTTYGDWYAGLTISPAT